MMRATLSFVLAMAAAIPAAADITKEDVRKLVEHRISDEVIVAFIQSSGPVARLTSEDLVELKKVGASDRVVLALLDGRRRVLRTRPAPTSPAERREDVPQMERVAPQPLNPYRGTVRTTPHGCSCAMCASSVTVAEAGWAGAPPVRVYSYVRPAVRCRPARTVSYRRSLPVRARRWIVCVR